MLAAEGGMLRRRRSLVRQVLLTSGVLLLAPSVAANVPSTNGPSLTSQAFEQIDANGVDLINGNFHFTGPTIVAGPEGHDAAAALRWNGRMWDLGVPSIWVDEEKSLFVNTGRGIDEFEYNSSYGWRSARGNGSTINCIFWDEARTYMKECRYYGHDGSDALFNSYSPYANLPQPPLTLPLGNVRATQAQVYFTEGDRTAASSGSDGSLHRSDHRGYTLATDSLYATTATIRLKGGPGAVAATPAERTIRLSTPGLTYDDRYKKNALMPKGVTQTAVDTLGQSWYFTFSDAGNLTHVRRPGSATNDLVLTYDSKRRVTSYSDGTATWTYSYTSGIPLDSTTATAPDGGQTVVSYIRKKGYARIVKDPRGRTTVYEYDDRNRVKSVHYPEKNHTLYTHDARGNVTSETKYPKPGSTAPVLLVSAGYPDSCPTGGSCNNPSHIVDAAGKRTDLTWVGNDIASITKPAASPNAPRPETRFKYIVKDRYYRNSSGTIVAASQPRRILSSVSECRTLQSCEGTADELRTTIDYGVFDGSVENFRWPLKITRSAGDGSQSSSVTLTYDGNGNILTQDGPLTGVEDVTRFRYDAARRLVGKVDPDPDGAGGTPAPAVRTSYNPAGLPVLVESGHVSSQSDADWSGFTPVQRTATAYDRAGRPVMTAVAGDGGTLSVSQTSYFSGRPQCTAVRMKLDAFPTVYSDGSIYGGDLPADACTPGAAGTHGSDRIERRNFNIAGELESIERAYGTALQQTYAAYSYSDNGKQQTVTDANGNLAQLVYDGQDRQTHWYFPSKTVRGQIDGGDFEEYGYDLNGNRTSLRKRDGKTIVYGYDDLNRMTSKTVPASASGAAGYSVFYGYDLAGAQLHARFGSHSGPGVTNTYDVFGQLSSSTTNMDGADKTVSHLYDANGNRSRIYTSTNYQLDFRHDAAGRMTEIWERGPNLVAKFTYDAMGRRSGLAQGSGGAFNSSAAYEYDAAGRLKRLARDIGWSTSADQTLTFDYNPASQIVTRTSSNDAYASNTAYDVNRSYSVNGLNQYTAAGPAAFQYDANGNLTSDGSTTFVYDAENRLVSASGAKTASLAYDPLGRLWQVSGGAAGTTRFHYDGDRLLEEYDGGGTRLRAYGHGPGVDEPFVWYELTGGPERRFLHADHQGSIIAAADESGNAMGINGYDAWGIPNANNSAGSPTPGRLASTNSACTTTRRGSTRRRSAGSCRRIRLAMRTR